MYWVGSGWVSQLMGWVGSDHTKWTHGQLCFRDHNLRLGVGLEGLESGLSVGLDTKRFDYRS